MSGTGLILMLLLVVLAVHPAVMRTHRKVRAARAGVAELKRRKRLLSLQVRALARESLGQRLTSGRDTHESEAIHFHMAELERRLVELQSIDRRVLVLDERRGLTETGWILLIRRPPDAAPPLEPGPITQLWAQGRYFFFFAPDQNRARRKAMVRFSPEQGFEIVDIQPHEGDLSQPPVIGVRTPPDQRERA